MLALSRAPRKHPTTPTRRWLGARLPDAIPPLPPVGAVLSLGPLDLFAEWLDQWQPAAGAPHIVALSSMSVVSKSDSAHAGERALASRMLNAEQTLRARCDTLGLPWTILRPTMLWGGGRDRTLSSTAQFAMRWRCMPMPAARGLRQPMHIDDLADGVIATLHRNAARGQLMPCGGGQRLAIAEMVQRLRSSLPRQVIAVPVPALALRACSRAARFSRAAAAIARLNCDLVADNAKFEALLDVHPRGFAPQPQDWNTVHQ